MGAGDDVDNGEAEPGARACARGIPSAERLERPCREFRGKPGPASRTWSSIVVLRPRPASTTIRPLPWRSALSTRLPTACSARSLSTLSTMPSSATVSITRPASSARGRKRSAMPATARRPNGLTAYRDLPPSARASTSRSSASRDSRSVSSAADRTALSSSSGVRSRRSARSSSARSIASGVLSSWLASATNRRSRSSADSRRASMLLSVSPSLWSSSSAGGSVNRLPGSDADTASASCRIASTGRSAAAARK